MRFQINLVQIIGLSTVFPTYSTDEIEKKKKKVDCT